MYVWEARVEAYVPAVHAGVHTYSWGLPYTPALVPLKGSHCIRTQQFLLEVTLKAVMLALHWQVIEGFAMLAAIDGIPGGTMGTFSWAL